MSQNISNICCKLVALSCLNGKAKEHVWQQWNNRFHDHEAFWLDVHSDQTAPEIAQAVTQMIANQGIVALAGKTVVFSVFLDLTQSPNGELISQIIKVPTILKNVLGCNIPLTMEFGNLGQMAFADKSILQQNTKQVVALNCQIDPLERKQLCLVANSPLVHEDQDNNWKAVIVLLDVLRRMADPASFVPIGDGTNPNNDVCFIRYGENNTTTLQLLTEKKTRLQLALGSGGESELKTVVSLALAKIENGIENEYIVNGGAQPVHPHMKLERFIDRMRGNNSPKFIAARNATWSALELTARGLRQTIMEDYQPKIAGAAKDLQSYIEQAKVGIELEADTHLMENILKPDKVNLSEPLSPSLAYSEGGYTAEIEKYLKDIRKQAAGKVRTAYAQALLDAYKAIPESTFAAKRAALTKEIATVNIQLNNILSREDFINMIAANHPLRQTAFFPVLGRGTGVQCALCRNHQDEQELNSACHSGVLYIDEKFGGLKALDEAPIKALQLLVFDCDDEQLNDLIK